MINTESKQTERDEQLSDRRRDRCDQRDQGWILVILPKIPMPSFDVAKEGPLGQLNGARFRRGTTGSWTSIT